MARTARNERGHGLYHVYARGNDRQQVFGDDDDRRDYLLRLRLLAEELGWRCLAYCLMGNHLHLIIETRRANLGRGMRWLQGGYARDFNRRYGRSGHLWGDRYGSVVIKSDDHFRTAVRYLARNPLEAGLAKEAGEWPWDNLGAAEPSWTTRIVDARRLAQLLDATVDELRGVIVRLAAEPP